MRGRTVVLLAPAATVSLVSAVMFALDESRWALAMLALSTTLAWSALALILLGLHQRLQTLTLQADRQAHVLSQQGRQVTGNAQTAHKQLVQLRKVKEQVRRSNGSISAQSETLVKVSKDAAQVLDLQSTLREQQARTAGRLHELTGRTVRDGNRYRTTLDSLPSDILRLSKTFSDLVPGDAALPALGGWAVTPATMMTMLDEVRTRPGLTTILECGSGTSTLLFALALRREGRAGHVFALESDPVFAEQTRAMVRDHGVEHLATVIDAPIVDVEVPGFGTRPWFDVARMPTDIVADLLFVDAPVGAIATDARYPAFPMLAQHVSDGALVVLDDTDRDDESSAAALWLGERHHGVGLRKLFGNVRSTFFRASTALEDG